MDYEDVVLTGVLVGLCLLLVILLVVLFTCWSTRRRRAQQAKGVTPGFKHKSLPPTPAHTLPKPSPAVTVGPPPNTTGHMQGGPASVAVFGAAHSPVHTYTLTRNGDVAPVVEVPPIEKRPLPGGDTGPVLIPTGQTGSVYRLTNTENKLYDWVKLA